MVDHKMKKKIIIGVLAGMCVLACIVAVLFYRTFMAENVQNREVTVTVPPEATFEQVMDTLRKHEVLKSEETFRKTANALKYKTMRIGKYDISDCRTNLDLVRLLRRGQHYPVKFTFNNTRTAEQFVEKVGNKFFFEPEELSALLRDGSYMRRFGLSDTTAVCLFIPNTYECWWNSSPDAFIQRMYREYQRFWNETRRAKAAAIPLSPLEVMTLASIVEEENFHSAEQPRIAGLYINRLRKEMRLQSDPTVKFALGDFAKSRLLYRDLETDSPYNTYLYAGLPPGPIRMASINAIDAVLNYEHHPYLFMCAKEDFSGEHHFTQSEAVHAANARRYHAALNRLNR